MLEINILHFEICDIWIFVIQILCKHLVAKVTFGLSVIPMLTKKS